MGKPEIVGYEYDPNNWSAPRMPDLYFDPEGIAVDDWGFGLGNMPFEYRRHLTDDEIDPFMRHHGWKRVYKPREFRAEPIGNGCYKLYHALCRYYWNTDKLPHDSAALHAREYCALRHIARKPPQVYVDDIPVPQHLEDCDCNDCCTHEEIYMGRCVGCGAEINEEY